MKIVSYILFHCSIYFIECTPVANKTQTQDIQELENERAELIKQLNVAIEDSVKTLQNSNDSDANEGIKYIKQLKEQLEELVANDAISKEEKAIALSDNEVRNNSLVSIVTNTRNITNEMSSGRRSNRDDNDRIKELLAKFSKVAGDKKPDKNGVVVVESKKKQRKLKNRIEIEKKLEAWLKQKEVEKKMIQAYKNKIATPPSLLRTEKCPDNGVELNKRKRPCCRKCCKSSYLGCLK